jgi:hypothetical protein
MWAQAINIIIGLLVMVAPDIWHFDKIASHNNHIAGPMVITFAITALWEVNRNVRWFNIPIGFWLIFSPLFFHFSTTAININIFSGLFIVILSLFKGSIKQRFGGGWRSLWQKTRYICKR